MALMWQIYCIFLAWILLCFYYDIIHIVRVQERTFRHIMWLISKYNVRHPMQKNALKIYKIDQVWSTENESVYYIPISHVFKVVWCSIEIKRAFTLHWSLRNWKSSYALNDENWIIYLHHLKVNDLSRIKPCK